MKPSIEIQFRKIPGEIIEGFGASIDESISLTIYHDENDHFEPPADIVVYVNDHLTELIVGGLMVNAVWDGIKYAVGAVWKKLITYCSKRKKGNEYLELSFRLKPDRTIDFSLNGSFDHTMIDTAMKEIHNYLIDKERQEKDFNNPAFKDNIESKPKIRMKWNREIRNWVPENYAEIRRQHEQWLKTVNRKLHS